MLGLIGALALASPARGVLSDVVGSASDPATVDQPGSGPVAAVDDVARADTAPGQDNSPSPVNATAQGILPAGRPAPPANIPTLSDQDKTKAKVLVASDPALRRLLGTTSYDVSQMGIWTTFGNKPIGAVLELSLPSPQRLSGDWPHIVYDEQETHSPPYTKKTVNFTAEEVKSLLVRVDLGVPPAVVSVSPLPDARILPSPEMQPTTPPKDYVGR